MADLNGESEPAPSEWGGAGWQEVEYGHRWDCANEPGHEEHDEYSDHLRVSTWPWDGRRHQERDPHEVTHINGHPVAVVQRTITYGPWVDADSVGEPRDRLAECHEQSQAAWDFVVWCSKQDYRGPMPEYVRLASELLTERRGCV